MITLIGKTSHGRREEAEIDGITGKDGTETGH
jgi:hypothetical protein